ncbi:MAG TPA: hypothetical protein VF411_12700 [Bacteroidia bacterium]
MRAKVAVYETHEEALNAVRLLKDNKFPIDKVSIVGKALIVDNNMYLKSVEPLKNLPIAIGTIAGIAVGILTGIGVFAIPGFGVLYGAGAIVGAAGGLELGLVGGGLTSILVHLGVKESDVLKYEEHLHAGNFLVVAQGNPKEIERAEHILHTEGAHLVPNTA